VLRSDDLSDEPLSRGYRIAHRISMTLIAVSTAMLLAVVIEDRFFPVDPLTQPSGRRSDSPAMRETVPHPAFQTDPEALPALR
jgi:hypothetical protein